ncbi:ret finger protein-like 4A [Colossoma macropomum]|uniref:ret finger protein-like 4A n=1 Tax=Colossoma macropomum TaxID=42526 RepID=UPI0018654601|nr:ret finger protein-like 4A [Colossoma macropomum]
MTIFSIPKIRDRILPKNPKSATKEEQTHLVGEFTPPCPVSALREISRTDGATQTPVSEKKDKETNTEKRKEIPDWEKMLACKVAIRPVTPTVPSLDVGKKKSRVMCTSDLNDKTAFIHVLCEERISSGRYYWEITVMIEPHTSKNGKSYKCSSSWYVGVTNETAEKRRKVPLTPQNGYWVLHYEKEKGYYVNDPSQTPVLVRDRFSKLGVFLDCEKHKLSFYDCDKQTHLYTFYDVHSTPLIPVLSPGDKQQHTIMISQEKCVKCDELYQP